jgi:hypothetical protein
MKTTIKISEFYSMSKDSHEDFTYQADRFDEHDNENRYDDEEEDYNDEDGTSKNESKEDRAYEYEEEYDIESVTEQINQVT